MCVCMRVQAIEVPSQLRYIRYLEHYLRTGMPSYVGTLTTLSLTAPITRKGVWVRVTSNQKTWDTYMNGSVLKKNVLPTDKCPPLLNDVKIEILGDDKKMPICALHFNINMERCSVHTPLSFSRADLDGDKRLRGFRSLPATKTFSVQVHVDVASAVDNISLATRRRSRRMSDAVTPPVPASGSLSPGVVRRPVRDPEKPPLPNMDTPHTHHVSLMADSHSSLPIVTEMPQSALLSSNPGPPNVNNNTTEDVPSKGHGNHVTAQAYRTAQPSHGPGTSLRTANSMHQKPASTSTAMQTPDDHVSGLSTMTVSLAMTPQLDLGQLRLQQFGFVQKPTHVATSAQRHSLPAARPSGNPAQSHDYSLMQSIASIKLSKTNLDPSPSNQRPSSDSYNVVVIRDSHHDTVPVYNRSAGTATDTYTDNWVEDDVLGEDL
eukprot:c12315_g1_i1.p1 GENE.c12315_g1_i1~~c12315_g1_i1.p1  ORF type:complete len:433 (+),score=97.09 c12315_g1_i1:2420-3718(+)